MKRKPAQPLQAQPSQSTTQSNVKCVLQRVPHPTTEKSVMRLPPPPEPRHLLKPTASTERQCANKPAVMQQELFVICKMLSQEVSEPQQAVPYKALTAPSEEQRSKAIKHSFDTSAEIDIAINASGLLGANTVDAGMAPSLEFPNLVWQTWYRCDYCGIAKASTSGVKNSRTRIRCQCGGTRQDGVLRLHEQ